MTHPISQFARRYLPRRRSTRLIALAGTLFLALAIWAVFWTANVAGRAEALSVELRATAGAARSTIVAADPDAVAAIRRDVEATAPRAAELKDDMWPLRAAGAVVGWTPWLGDNVTAPPDLADRLVDDIDAVLGLVDAAERLARTYDLIPAEAAGISDALAALPDEAETREIRDILLASDAALARAEDTATGVRDGRLWGRLATEARDLRAQEADLRELLDWTLLATDSLAALARLAGEASALTAVLDTGDASGISNETLERMPRLEAAAATALSAVSAAVATAPDAVSGSSIGASLRDLAPVLDGLHATARTGAVVADVVIPAFDHVKESGTGLFGRDSGLLESISAIGRNVERLRGSRTDLQAAIARLHSARPSIATPFARTAADSLLSLTADLELAVGLLEDLPEIAPGALGADGVRRYLVLAESADEIRAAGGLVSGAWILEFADGALVESTYRDVVEVDDLTSLDRYPAPPELLAGHMDAPVWLLRDVSWEPDFPSVARSAAQMLSIGQGGIQVDGVVALTQWAMLDLADALGSINTAAGPISSDGLLAALEAGTDEEGREFMNTLFLGLLDQTSGPAVDGRLFQLALAASTSLTEKQVLVHLFDDDLQAVVSRAGWAGTVPGGGDDRIAAFDSNVGWSKVDRNIRRSLDYEVALNPDGPSAGTVVARYENASNAGSSGCEGQRIDRGPSYEELKNACYWNLLRVYTADSAALMSASPLPLPENSVFATLGLAAPGDDTVGVGAGPAGSFVTGLVVVPPGETVEARFALELPAGVVDWSADTATYTLELAAQPGALGRATKVRIEMPPGRVYAGSSVTPASVEEGVVLFDLDLRRDTSLTLAMGRAASVRSGAAPASGEPEVTATPR